MTICIYWEISTYITQMKKNNKFNEILTCLDRKQHVSFPTLVHSRWLDLLITKRIKFSNSINHFFRHQVFQTI